MDTQHRLQDVSTDLLGMQSRMVTEQEVTDSLRKLDPIWDKLYPTEQIRIIQLLVEKVTVNTDGMDIRIRTDGVHSLISELRGTLDAHEERRGGGRKEVVMSGANASIQPNLTHQEVTSIPRTPSFVEGVINLRGSIIPVIDLRKRFGLAVGEITKASRIVVVEAADQMIGMMVDSVCETLKLPKDAIEPPSPIVVNVDSAYVRGVGKQDGRLVILLDVEKVLTAKETDLISKIKADDNKKAA